jgi:hypothetical protein
VTRILIAFLQGAPLRPYERSYVAMLTEELQRNQDRIRFVIEAHPARADIIILLESAEYKTVEYLDILENDPLIQKHADRVYTINYDDHPEGMLAGLYTSLEEPFFNPEIHGIWPVLFMNNPLVYDLTQTDICRSRPSRLFSFTGAESHEVRKRLFALFSQPSSERRVERVTKWYNHDDSDRRHFVNVALDSMFSLCPRGFTCYTHRIPEIMALSRVPVIIADDWIPFSFEQAPPYYIKVPETDIEYLPDILSARRDEAEQYGRNARMVWEKHCSEKRRTVAAVERIATMAAERQGLSYAHYRELWHSKAFLLRAGWTLRQRVSLRLQQHLRRFVPSIRLPGLTPDVLKRNAPNLKMIE